MKIFWLGSRRWAGLFLVVLMCLSATAVSAKEVIVIFVAASAITPVRAAVGLFVKNNAGIEVRLSAASSSALARQLDAGAQADIFISANVQWMDWAQQRKRIIAASRFDLMINRLVVLVPRTSDYSTDAYAALTKAAKTGPVAMADPDYVPAGLYGRAALKRIGLWNRLRERIVRGPDSRTTVTLVASGEAAAGIGYATDARLSSRVRIAAEFKAASHPTIVYPIAAVANRNRPVVKSLLAFLKSPTGQAVMLDHGFIPARPF